MSVKRLQAHIMSTRAIPPGGGLLDGIRFLRDPARVRALARQAASETATYIAAVRDTADADPSWTDDEIAAKILDALKERK